MSRPKGNNAMPRRPSLRGVERCAVCGRPERQLTAGLCEDCTASVRELDASRAQAAALLPRVGA